MGDNDTLTDSSSTTQTSTNTAKWISALGILTTILGSVSTWLTSIESPAAWVAWVATVVSGVSTVVKGILADFQDDGRLNWSTPWFTITVSTKTSKK